MRKVIYTNDAPEPAGPYSQAIELNGMIFTAGQIPIDPATGTVATGGIEAETRQVFANLKAVLNGAECALDRVVKMTIYMTNMADFPAMNAVYGEYFDKATAPARSTVEVSELPKGAAIEIDAIAVK